MSDWMSVRVRNQNGEPSHTLHFPTPPFYVQEHAEGDLSVFLHIHADSEDIGDQWQRMDVEEGTSLADTFQACADGLRDAEHQTLDRGGWTIIAVLSAAMSAVIAADYYAGTRFAVATATAIVALLHLLNQHLLETK